jgi:hypothetical protein
VIRDVQAVPVAEALCGVGRAFSKANFGGAFFATAELVQNLGREGICSVASGEEGVQGGLVGRVGEIRYRECGVNLECGINVLGLQNYLTLVIEAFIPPFREVSRSPS